ncbi:MAG: hypothetical protein LBV43_10830 [Prevotella sp.]|nr:hypothetical protein [Prevotella sp.]
MINIFSLFHRQAKSGLLLLLLLLISGQMRAQELLPFTEDFGDSQNPSFGASGDWWLIPSRDSGEIGQYNLGGYTYGSEGNFNSEYGQNEISLNNGSYVITKLRKPWGLYGDVYGDNTTPDEETGYFVLAQYDQTSSVARPIYLYYK